jgi:uncharacterized protein
VDNLARQRPALNEEQIAHVLKNMAGGFKQQLRSPILRTPAEQELEFEDVSFPSQDGVPLEAWFIPKEGSSKLVIVNHPRWFNRYGMPSHLEPWKSLGAMAGNDFEVNFIPDYKILHDAGYNVLTYDLRNFGHSGAGNGGVGSGGWFESRDVIGSLIYAKTRSDLSGMTIGLFSRCLGCNATMFAASRGPDYFRDVKCMVGVQPLSVKTVMERILELIGVPTERIEELNREVKLATSFTLDDMTPLEAAKSVTIPTFLYQVKDDLMTRPSDVQAIYDNVASNDKELFWILGSSRRWDGYTHFSRDPSRMLAWFDKYMS